MVFARQIQDMVAIRHAGPTCADLRTTLILLCEDGSLRIYMANAEQTNYWMLPTTLQSGLTSSVIDSGTKTDRKKKLASSGLFRFSKYSRFFIVNCRKHLAVHSRVSQIDYTLVSFV